ncbi:MAG: Flp family type IVb pilin [Candidatus Binatia bacterium]
MNDLLKRFLAEEEGQGITEYALILGLVVFAIWIAVSVTNLPQAITSLFSRVGDTINNCTSSGCP